VTNVKEQNIDGSRSRGIHQPNDEGRDRLPISLLLVTSLIGIVRRIVSSLRVQMLRSMLLRSTSARRSSRNTTCESVSSVESSSSLALGSSVDRTCLSSATLCALLNTRGSSTRDTYILAVRFIRRIGRLSASRSSRSSSLCGTRVVSAQAHEALNTLLMLMLMVLVLVLASACSVHLAILRPTSDTCTCASSSGGTTKAKRMLVLMLLGVMPVIVIIPSLLVQPSRVGVSTRLYS